MIVDAEDTLIDTRIDAGHTRMNAKYTKVYMRGPSCSYFLRGVTVPIDSQQRHTPFD